nr:hypothetical protein [uncultured bacterium]
MKKTLFVLMTALLAVSMVLTGCASSGGGGGSSGGAAADALVLYENGVWNSALGNVQLILFDSSNAAVEDGLYITKDTGTGLRFIFENPIDASAYKYLLIETAEGSDAKVGYWAGGQLLNYTADAYAYASATKLFTLKDDNSAEAYTHPATSNNVIFGFWSGGVLRSGNVRYPLTGSGVDYKLDDPTSGRYRPDPSKLSGFGVKCGGGGTLSVKKVSLTN